MTWAITTTCSRASATHVPLATTRTKRVSLTARGVRETRLPTLAARPASPIAKVSVYIYCVCTQLPPMRASIFAYKGIKLSACLFARRHRLRELYGRTAGLHSVAKLSWRLSNQRRVCVECETWTWQATAGHCARDRTGRRQVRRQTRHEKVK